MAIGYHDSGQVVIWETFLHFSHIVEAWSLWESPTQATTIGIGEEVDIADVSLIVVVHEESAGVVFL